MLSALKNSPEKKELVDAAVKYLRGVKGSLVQTKSRKEAKARQKAMDQNGGIPVPVPPPSGIGRPPKISQVDPTPHAPSSNASNGIAPPTLLDGPPQREVSTWYKGPLDPLHTPAGARAQGQRSAADQQRMLQIQAHGQLNEAGMGNALRGFLDT